MTSPADVPAEVVGLADARAAAKGARDYAQADLLREQIAALGYLVTDAPDGYRLSVKPPFDVVPSMEALAEGPYAEGARCAVLLLVEGWPEDLDACVRAIVAHSDPSVVVPDDDAGATVEVSGKVSAKNDDGTATIALTASSGGSTVLGQATAVVRLAP